MRDHRNTSAFCSFTRLALIGAAAISLASPVHAEILTKEQAEALRIPAQEFTCPITGENFEQAVGYPHLPFEAFPDGSHFGDQWVDNQIPECPADGLLILPDFTASLEGSEFVYYDYSNTDIARLPALLDDPDFLSIPREMRYLRAYRLAEVIGRPAGDLLRILFRANWGASSAELRRQALELLVNDGPSLLEEAALEVHSEDEHRLVIIGALRELGRFDEALEQLESMEQEIADYLADEGEEPLPAGQFQYPKHRDAITSHNQERFPLVLLSTRHANSACNSASASNPPVPLRTIKECEPRRAESFEQRGSFDDILANAELAIFEQVGGQNSQVDNAEPAPPAVELAALCREFETRRGDQEPDMDIYYQCQASYRGLKNLAYVDILLTDPIFHQICAAPLGVQFGQSVAPQYCVAAHHARVDQAASQLFADRSALTEQCAAISGFDRDLALYRACYALESGGDTPYWTAFADTERFDDPLYHALLPYAQEDLQEAAIVYGEPPRSSD